MRTIAVLLVAAQLVCGAALRDWKTAVLQETHREHMTGELWPTQFYTLDAGDRLIICSQRLIDGMKKAQPIDVPVGATLRYARSSPSQIVVQDRKGKEHKLTIEQETMKSQRP